nr:hypothetical protein [Tanacetum cinerariifolium]
MDLLSPQVVSAAKLPILNPNEFDLWKMRIEQYFLMTDYLLWEVILNGDSPVPIRVVDGVLQPVASTTTEQMVARKNELKDAKILMEVIKKRFGGNTETKKVQKTLLKQQYENFIEDINLKFLRSLPSEWRTHTLIWRNKIDLEEQSLDDLFNSLKIYEAEVKSSSSTGTTTQNIAFVSSSNTDSTTEPVSAAASVSAVCAKMAVSSLSNVDFLSNAMIYSIFASQSSSPQLDNNDLKGENRPTYLGFDMSKVECYNRHRKGHFARECRSPKDTRRNGDVEPQRRNVLVETSTSNALVSQCDGVGSYDWSFQEEDEPANYARPSHLQVLLSTMRYQSGNGYHAVPLPYTGTFMPPKPDLVFNNVIPNDIETDHSDFTTKTQQNVPSFVQSTKQVKSPRLSIQHVKPSIPAVTPKPASSKPTSNSKRRNRKACFVCKSLDHLLKDCDYHEKKMAQPTARNHTHRGNHKYYTPMTYQNPQMHMVPTPVLTQSKPVPITAIRPVSTAVPKINVTRPRHAKPIITKSNSPTRRHINHSPSPKVSNSPPKAAAVKAPMINAAQVSNGLGPKENLTILFLVQGNPHHALKDKGVIDSGCSRKMTGNMSYLSNFKELNGGYVAFGGNPKGGKISGKGKLKIRKLDYDDVYFVKELKNNLFSVSQMCDKKNSVLFTDTECFVLSLDFKLPDESQVLLRVPRENNMYNVNLKNIVPYGDLTCLFAKATINKSNLWHRRLGHINFKTMNKLVKGNLVRGLPIKVFENDNTCVACKKGKQHRASYDYSRFTWVFFLATKDETSLILENQLSLKVKVIRSDNETKFKNHDLNQVCGMKGIKREFNVPRTPQQNGIVERKNRTLIEAARTMLADSLLPIPFCAEALNTACYNTDGDAAFDGKELEFDAKKPESKFNVSPSSSAQSKKQDDNTKREATGKSAVESFTGYKDLSVEFKDCSDNNINEVNTSEEPKRVYQALKDPSWIEAMQEELLQFKMQKVWVLVDLPYGKSAIGTKWVFRNKKDERGIMVRNKARLVTQGHTQEEGIDYEEVFTLVARIEAIRLFLAYAYFIGFMVYQMDVKSAFLYGNIEEEVYVCQPLGFEDSEHPDKVYKVVKALYGLHQARRA